MKRILLGALTAATFALPAMAGSEITITDAYARAAGASAMAGAAFFVIENTGDEDDRLIGVFDIDSPKLERFTDEDRVGLEAMLAAFVAGTDF